MSKYMRCVFKISVNNRRVRVSFSKHIDGFGESDFVYLVDFFANEYSLANSFIYHDYKYIDIKLLVGDGEVIKL